jgi:LuxR family maltose regulon positive regulatory protein
MRRERLSAQLMLSRAHKLTVVAGPAGAGKTTALSLWHAESDIPTAWLTLDAADDDPACFWHAVLLALDGITTDLGTQLLPALISTPPTPIVALLPALAAALAAYGNELTLLLDDYHVITEPSIHQTLALLLSYLPANAHVVIAGRTAPPLPLARWRAHGQLLEIGARDLAFTPDEATRFLRDFMALDLPQQISEQLHTATDGWITGLRLAAQVAQAEDDPQQALAACTGDHRMIADYFAQELMQRLPPEAQRFLLETSILDYLHAPLCDAVREQTDSRHWLEELERSNSFLVALDDRRHVYRYQHLFQIFLRARLQQHDPNRRRTLHRRAAAWYATQADRTPAIEHALAGGDYDPAARLIVQEAESLRLHGAWRTLRRWVDALPQERVTADPRLRLIAAWAMLQTRQVAAAGAHVQALAALEAIDADHETAELRGELALLQERIAAFRSDIPALITHGRRALTLLPEHDTARRSDVLLDLGHAYRTVDDLAAAEQAFAAAITTSRSAGNMWASLLATYYQAQTHISYGRLSYAQALYRQALAALDARGGSALPMAGVLHVGLAELFYQWNEFEQARDAIE